jgi:hypothetical protein
MGRQPPANDLGTPSTRNQGPTGDHLTRPSDAFRHPYSAAPAHLYPTLVLALRDMRCANGRDPTTGDGDGNDSWIGLIIGMTVPDTLSGEGDADKVKKRWVRLLTDHGVSAEDAKIIYALRCSLLHGYGLPTAEKACGRRVVLSSDRDGQPIDTSKDGLAVLSVRAFCKELVERIAAEAPDDWDASGVRIYTDYRLA